MRREGRVGDQRRVFCDADYISNVTINMSFQGQSIGCYLIYWPCEILSPTLLHCKTPKPGYFIFP
ncbi:hypothetical protein H4S14_001863 [Agrobacterium vitis]|nr:hypothetical protein [Agrobacterium vitis]MBE1438118.1 hypothetical protein [Agrobacterium vitis]